MLLRQPGITDVLAVRPNAYPARGAGLHRPWGAVSAAVALRLVVVSALLMSGPAVGRSLPHLPDDMHQWALQSIDLVYNEDFGGALDAAKRIVKAYPKHPAGYFFCAASVDSWMASFQSNKREDEFYQYCNEAVEKAEEMIDNGKDDAWVHFFMGGAEGLKGSYEMRFQRSITAFRYGWKGVTVLRELQVRYEGMRDVDYGIGSYLYWRSAMADRLKWLPGVRDERQQGVELLMSARTGGVYTKVASAAALMEVLRNESRYDTLLAIADEMLAKYPHSLVFQQGEGVALFGLGRFADAERVFKVLGARAESGPFENRYNAVVAHYWLAKTHHRLGQYDSCIVECERIHSYALSEDLASRLEDCLSEVQDLQHDAVRHRGAPPGNGGKVVRRKQ